MKHFKLPKLSRGQLDARGISHIAVPLAVMVLMAIGGTYMVVANRTNSLASITGGTAATKPLTAKPTKAKPKAKKLKSYLVIYSEQGRYSWTKIHALNIQAGTHSCGGNFTAPSYDIVKSLHKGNLKVSCASIGGNEAYYVYFSATKDFKHWVAVDVDPGYCTLVHANPALIRKVPVDAHGKCVGADTEPDVPTKTDVTLRVLPKLSANKKSITGVVEMSIPGEGISRVACTGQVTVQHLLTKDTTVAGTRNFPLKYVGATSSRNSYCVAKISNLQNVKPGNTYVVKAWFTGSVYFNPANDLTTITIPPAKK